jgi:hypothetical protein
VPKPERDNGPVNAVVEQIHGSAMSKDVWGNPLTPQGSAAVLRHGSMLRDEVLDRVTAERPTAEAGEKSVVRLALSLSQPCLYHCDNLSVKRRAAFFASLSFAANVGARSQDDVLAAKADELGDSQSCLDR